MNLQPGTIGIIPPGALGVGFYYHLTRELRATCERVFFIAPDDSPSAAALRRSELRILAADGTLHTFPGEKLIPGTLSEIYAQDRVPEILLVCPNPDQFLGLVTSLVGLLERQSAAQDLQTDRLAFPAIIFSSNGIYFQRIRQVFIEKLEESTLFGRLPDLWPDLMPALVGRLLRGVTIQTGLREGSGAETIYRPGKRGLSRLAGGDPALRERCARLLNERGAWFELATDSSPTRLEFDKGLINLISNFFGLIHAFQPDGSFLPLRVDQILIPENEGEIRELAAQVFAVGRAVKAYGSADTAGQVLDDALAMSRKNGQHIPSSLQWVDLRLRQGVLTAEFTPTEEWLITPLIKYARSANLREAETYFAALRERLLAKLTLAVRHQAGEKC